VSELHTFFGVFSNYTAGVAVAIAIDKESAIQAIIDQTNNARITGNDMLHFDNGYYYRGLAMFCFEDDDYEEFCDDATFAKNQEWRSSPQGFIASRS
jgi:hypothetical protein